MDSWSNATLSGGLVPVEVPIGDLMDMADIDEDQALSYERRKLDRMLGRYDAMEAAIMIAVPDKTLSGMSYNSGAALGRLRISIYRTDRANAEHVQDIFLEADGKETVKGIYDRGVASAYEALQKDWKRKTLASAAQSQLFYVRVPLANVKQWVQVRQALTNISGLNDISVLSMKKVEARLSFKYRGDIKHLRDNLSRASMSLGQGYPNGSAHKFTDNQRGAPEMMYDLTYRGAPKIQSNNFYRGVESAPAAEDAGMVHTF